METPNTPLAINTMTSRQLALYCVSLAADHHSGEDLLSIAQEYSDWLDGKFEVGYDSREEEDE